MYCWGIAVSARSIGDRDAKDDEGWCPAAKIRLVEYVSYCFQDSRGDGSGTWDGCPGIQMGSSRELIRASTDQSEGYGLPFRPREPCLLEVGCGNG